ncbi:MAG: hypothetical protein EDQ89_06425 [Acidobacteria bacterium]|nr:MAG: hypothetical protein EDQ89_06425 [Acidobacteriota bacterium]MCL4287051.1 multicopper oxidase domain-containing protein [Thermoleophilia bacterium]
MRSIGRRELVADAGALFLCGLAGKQILLDQPADVEALAKDVEVPPKVEAARAGGAPEARTVLAAAGGTREYWIRAEKVRWNVVPTGRDQMMRHKVKGRTTFTAYAYRQYTEDFGEPLGKAKIPGPLIEADIGDVVIVHFENRLPVPVTIHPHGIQYSADMDGSYKGPFTDPGGFVQRGDRVDYMWEAIPGSEGAWFYHDHGPVTPIPLYKGLFGPIIVRDPAKPRPDREFFVGFHAFPPAATGIKGQMFSCVNGRAFTGNTPNFQARVGEDVAWHVYVLDNYFHTFHLHGHRWRDPSDSRNIDNFTVGPGDVESARFIEDNPGRWFYHCHVFSHLEHGMIGWYRVE